ncbi:MAG: hypothetical protein KDJ37_08470 [Hyphomicrobiaceae bacterium]|nr:hypothetical protein [Hyphomicrobiaceae bacterium]
MKLLASVAWPLARPIGRRHRLADAAMGIAAIAMTVAATLAEPLDHAMQQAGIDTGKDTASTRDAGSELSRLALPTREVMIGAYAGAPYTYPSTVSLKKSGQHDFSVEDVEWEAKPFESPIYYGARVIRWFDGGRTGAMVDFTHSKALSLLGQEKVFKGTISGAPAPAKAILGDVFRRLEFSHGHNMLTLNGLWRLAFNLPRLSPYVGAGIGINLPHSEVQLKTAPGRTYEYQYTGPVAQAVIGIEFRVPRMSYFFEYKFSIASYEVPLTHRDGSILFVDLWRQFTRWLSGEEPPGGFAWTRLTSHQVIGGIGLRVGATPAAAP